MSSTQFPTNENLRLIMSADQEEWIRGKIRESKGFVRAMMILLAVSAAWIAFDFSAGGFLRYDDVDCYYTAGDSADDEVTRQELLDMGLKPCPPEIMKQRGFDLSGVRAIVTLSCVLLMLVSGLTLLRHLYLLRRYNGYLRDHTAFLAKHNRA